LPNGAVEVHSLPKDASAFDMLPSAEGIDVEAPSMSANAQGSSTPDANEDDIEKYADLEEDNTESLISPGQVFASGKDIQSEYTAVVSHVDEGSIEKTDDFQLNGLPFEHNQSKSKSALLCLTCISPCCPAYMIPMTLLTNK
jgi:hypothetical protein